MTLNSSLLDEFQKEITVAVGECMEILVQHPGGKILNCGDMISQDTVLGQDFHCTKQDNDGFLIVEDGVTLDLNGYTIYGEKSESSGGEDDTIAIVVSADDVTVTNGVIEGWDQGIGVFGRYANLITKNLSIRNLFLTDPDYQLNGYNISGARSALIEDNSFEFFPKFHSDGIGVGDAFVVASHNYQFGGSSAFGIGPYEFDHENEPIHVKAFDSIIKGTFFGSFFIQCVTTAVVQNNEFIPLTFYSEGEGIPPCVIEP
jgi:hypothetical protein